MTVVPPPMGNEKHVKQGSDLNVFLVLITTLLIYLSPLAVCLIEIFFTLQLGLYTNALCIFVGMLGFYAPIYAASRFQLGMRNSLAVFMRSWIAPILFVIGYFPVAHVVETELHENADTANYFTFGKREKALLGFVIAKLLLGYYRSLCKPTVSRANRLAAFNAKRKNSATKNDNTQCPMRILLVGDSFPPKVDGVATFAEETAEKLLAFGHDVHIITSIRGPATIAGVSVTRLPGVISPIALGHSVTLPLPTLFWEFIKFKPDVVQALEIGPCTLVLCLYCQVADIPISISHHTRLDLYVDILTPQLPRFLNEFMLVSMESAFYPLADTHPAVCQVLVDRVVRLGGSDVRFWSSGVSTRFSEKNWSQEWRNRASGNKPDLPLVIYFGRLAPEKNSLELPKVINKTIEKMGGPNKVRFLIVGDGPDRKNIEEELQNEAVYFAGFQRDKNLLEAVASADVFFSPSTMEACPLVYLEAMASGLAVVGPNAGGTPDTFSDGVHGFYCEPNDTDSASNSIVRAIKEGKAMQSRALIHGKSYSWEKAVRDLESMLVDLVNRKEFIRGNYSRQV